MKPGTPAIDPLRDPGGDASAGIERRLRDTAELLRLAVDAANLGTWTWTEGEGRASWSEEAASLLGRPAEALPADFRAYLEMVHPDDREAFAAEVRPALTGRADQYACTHRIAGADPPRWIESRGRAQQDVKGRPVRIAGTVQDVTRRKEDERQLLASREELRSIFDTAPILILNCSAEGRIRFVNRLRPGQQESDVVGTSMFGWIAEEQRATVRERFFEAVKTRKRAVLEISADPRSGVGDRCFLVSMGPVAPHGEVESVTIAAVDITERKRIEDELSESRDRMRMAARTARIGFWDRDLARDTLHFDEEMCRLFEVDGPGLVDPDIWRTRVLPEDVERLDGEDKRVRAQGGEVSGEYRVPLENGTLRHVKFFGKVVQTLDGDPVRVVGISQDVTAPRELEARLRQSQRLESIGRLAGGVAHDFNNLLTAVIGYADLACEELADRPQVRRLVEQARDAAERGAGLTHQLLAFARKQVFRPETIDPAELLDRARDLLGRLIGETIVLTARAAPDLLRVRVDPRQIEQVLVNLAVNARDAMPRGGALTLTACNLRVEAGAAPAVEVEPGDYVQIDVVDTGEGMSADVLSRAFEPFFTTKPTGRGTGLGLSTCFGIVKQTGGHLLVESAPGCGSRFRILLPATAEPATRTEAPSPSARRIAPGRGRILLVEDEATVRSVACAILQEAGYELVAARDGRQALRRFEEHGGDFDLLVTDMVMPGLGGRELAERLLEARPALKVLYASGYTAGTLPEGCALGDDVDFIQKPFTPAELARRVRALLHA